MLDKIVRIKAIRELGSRNYLVTLRAPEQARLVRPGQFFMLKCAGGLDDLPLLRRPFTVFNVYRLPNSGRPAGLELLVKDVGTGSGKLVRMQAGQALCCLGPQGRGFQISAGMKNRLEIACLVAGGVGIAPLYLLAEELMRQNIRPVLFYGGAAAADLVLRESFEQLGMDTCYTTEDGSLGERGLVTAPLAQYLDKQGRRNIRVYACGPWGMMRAVHQLSARKTIPCEVSLEARMGCSLGACLGCVVRSRTGSGQEQYLRVCQEGPVIDSRLIDWETAPL